MGEPEYVDLENARRIREEIDRARDMLVSANAKMAELGMFCRECGIKNPPGGFYPLAASFPGTVSMFLCNECDKKSR